MLTLAPGYRSDAEAADTEALTLLCAQIGEPLDQAFAARRYALTGDRRALAEFGGRSRPS
ncbi:hypothetical protein ACFTWS_39835 [Streptomyces sp. NPDC057027]|uniref:hypothetical protein n=1 Tax=Streptomyces sp. NPDC057027 TaxID=3346004 RepID=UPI00363938D3